METFLAYFSKAVDNDPVIKELMSNTQPQSTEDIYDPSDHTDGKDTIVPRTSRDN
jgi:hypothetical protein